MRGSSPRMTRQERALSVSLHSAQYPSFPPRFRARTDATLLRQAPIEGGRSAERRSGAAAPVGHAMTRDARLSALHRGGFGLPGPRFRLLGRPPSYNGGQMPSGSVQRAPRTQVVVPGGRGPCLPRRAVTSRRRRTPRLAPHSGSSLEHALNEQAGKGSSVASQCSQEKNSFCVRNLAAKRDASHIVTTGNVKIVLCSV